jgi:RNA polymerase sigma factor (TIGR02999 family)
MFGLTPIRGRRQKRSSRSRKIFLERWSGEGRGKFLIPKSLCFQLVDFRWREGLSFRRNLQTSRPAWGSVSPEPSKEVTRLLASWGQGKPEALDQLMPIVYGELRRLAASYLRRERDDHTLQPTALVHEAFLRLVDQKDVQWQNRGHFFAITAQLMRRILVDHARTHLAEKRGSGVPRIPLTEAIIMSRERPAELLALDDGLKRLASLDPQQGRVVELRIFAGLTVEETAEVLGISPATVKRDWSMAKAWLSKEVQELDGGPES